MKKFLTIVMLAGMTAAGVLAADAAAGAALYEKSCKGCHGADGTANPAIVKMMKVEVPDLKSAEVQGLADADFKSIITSGKGKMRPVAAVTGAGVDDVIAFVHSLKK